MRLLPYNLLAQNITPSGSAREELHALSPPLSGAVLWYCEQALREMA